MRIGIIGAGFSGLAAALELSSKDYRVEVIEASDSVGGLASGFSLPGWEWTTEYYYHHIFANDFAVIRLAKEVRMPILFYQPLTSLYSRGEIYPFSSPLDLLALPLLSAADKLRMGTIIAFLKFNPFWKPLEKFSTHDFLSKFMGNEGYKLIWKPLLNEKFGPWATEVNAAWFWARIKKRTSKLGYFKGGFQIFADKLKDSITEKGGIFHLDNPISEVEEKGSYIEIKSTGETRKFDKVLVTTSTPMFLKIVKNLPSDYRNKLLELKYMDSLSVIFILKKPLLKDVYWLNIVDRNLPFVVTVEHTNMIDPKYYSNQHIVYLGSYLPSNHPYFKLDKKEVIKLAIDQLKKISPNFNINSIKKTMVFQKKDTQPVMPINYSGIRPSFITPIKNVYLANLSMVYPWDRGTNYAVELGEKVSKIIMKT